MSNRRTPTGFLSFALLLALGSACTFVAHPGGTKESSSSLVVLPAETNNIVTVVGSAIDIGDHGPAVNAILAGPSGITVDASDNIYIVELNGNRIRKVDRATGIITTVAGTGVAGFSGNNVPATAAMINGPRGVAFDALGNMYIADMVNHMIRKVSTTGIITTVAGNGTPGPGGDNGPAIDAQLNQPSGVSLDAAGNIFIADFNNSRVRKVTAATGIITTVAGTGVPDFKGDNGPATDARLNTPRGVFVDRLNNIYIGDTNNHCIRKVDTNGIITTVAGAGGIPGSTGENVPATDARLTLPRGVFVDVAGNLYIGDGANQKVRKVAPTGIITTVAGTGVQGSTGDNNPATLARLNAPYNSVVDSSGNLYIAEEGGGRARMVDPTGIITTIAGPGVVPLGDGFPATAAHLNISGGIAFDHSGDLYISDTLNNRIRKVGSDGIITTAVGTGESGTAPDGTPATAAKLTPSGIAFDSSGNLFVSTGILLRKISTAGIITTVAGTGVLGPYSGENLPALSSPLNAARGIAVDSAGTVYFAELGNQRIRKLSGGLLSTVAGNGQTVYSGDNVPATTTALNLPVGVALDASETVYIPESRGHRVRAVDRITGNITTVAGTGDLGGAGDGGPATAAQLNGPSGVAFDSAGNTYIGEGGGHRVRKISGGIISTVVGSGVGGFSGDGGPAMAAQLNGNLNLAFDRAGNLYLGDSNNFRVRRLQVAAVVDVVPSNDSWVGATLQLPLGRDAANVSLDSVVLQAIDPSDGALHHTSSHQVVQTTPLPSTPELLDTDGDGVFDVLKLKFDRATVASWAALYPGLRLRVQGQFQPEAGEPLGRYFSGDVAERDTDHDGIGDFSDPCPFDPLNDADHDGLCGDVDQCLATAPGSIVDPAGCAIEDYCPCADARAGQAWKTHGAYVSCVSQAADDFAAQGLVSQGAADAIVSHAAQSSCGR
jgi:sugar lactone lactonase YvrE